MHSVRCLLSLSRQLYFVYLDGCFHLKVVPVTEFLAHIKTIGLQKFLWPGWRNKEEIRIAILTPWHHLLIKRSKGRSALVLETKDSKNKYGVNDEYGSLNFLLRNYDKNQHFLEKMCLLHFYKLILLPFLQLKISYNTQFCRFVLFNDKDILIYGRPIFYRSWLNKTVFLSQDLLEDGGKVLPYSEFFGKFQLNGNFLFMQVVYAILKDLIDDTRRGRTEIPHW